MRVPLEPDMEPALARDRQGTDGGWGSRPLSPMEPDGEPDIASDIHGIAETMRAEVLQLQAAKDLTSSIQSIGLSLEMEPTPGDIMQAVLHGLAELQDLVQLAVNACSEPRKAGMFGEATLRARFGVKQLTELYSGVVAEQLVQCLEDVQHLQGTAKQVCDALKELHDALTTYSAGISSVVKNMEVLQQRVEALASRARSPGGTLDAATGSWKKALGLTAFAFEDLLRKLGDTQASLAPLLTEVTARLGRIEDFVTGAAVDVRAAFEVPTPACFCQALTIGKDSQNIMRTMLDRLNALKRMPLNTVAEVLAIVTKDVCALRLEEARAVVNGFAACAGGQLNSLDVLLVRARLADWPARRQEAPERLARAEELEASSIGYRAPPLPLAEDVAKTDAVAQQDRSRSESIVQALRQESEALRRPV